MKMSHEDKLPGGLADNKIPSDFKEKDLAQGIEVELEHTDTKNLAQEITMDHLSEDPEYYKKLEKMEKPNKKKASIDEKTGENINAPVKSYITHPNQRFEVGDHVVMIDPEEPEVKGEVLGHVAEDRVLVKWPNT